MEFVLINAIEFERTQIHYFSNIFIVVVVVIAYAPLYTL